MSLQTGRRETRARVSNPVFLFLMESVDDRTVVFSQSTIHTGLTLWFSAVEAAIFCFNYFEAVDANIIKSINYMNAELLASIVCADSHLKTHQIVPKLYIHQNGIIN